jgi:hypothetical protein
MEASIKGLQTAVQEDTPLPFEPPAVARSKVAIAFDGGTLTSVVGVQLRHGVSRRPGIAARLVGW